MILKKQHAVKTFSGILLQIFTDKGNKFPDSFDEFAYEIAKRLWQQFKLIEGNQVVYEKAVEQPEIMPLKITNTFELVDHKVHASL